MLDQPQTPEQPQPPAAEPHPDAAPASVIELPRVATLQIAVTFLESLLPTGSKILSFKTDEAKGLLLVNVVHPSFDPMKAGELPPTKVLVAYRGTHFERTEYQA